MPGIICLEGECKHNEDFTCVAGTVYLDEAATCHGGKPSKDAPLRARYPEQLFDTPEGLQLVEKGEELIKKAEAAIKCATSVINGDPCANCEKPTSACDTCEKEEA